MRSQTSPLPTRHNKWTLLIQAQSLRSMALLSISALQRRWTRSNNEHLQPSSLVVGDKSAILGTTTKT